MTHIQGMPDRRNFHDGQGRHMFPHPDTYARRSEMTAWDKAYARHLDRHRELVDNPEPQDGDPQIVLDLFAHIETLSKIIAKEKLLITALRQRAAEHPEADPMDLPDLRETIRKARS